MHWLADDGYGALPDQGIEEQLYTYLVDYLNQRALKPIMLDASPPEAGHIIDGDKHLHDLVYQNYDDRICVQWYGWFDAESGIDRYTIVV